MTVKCYLNTSDTDLNVLGLGVIPAGEQVSIHSEYPPVVILENYPGLVDISELDTTEVDSLDAPTPAAEVAAPVEPAQVEAPAPDNTNNTLQGA